VRLGRGSARDALSALDQLIATGSIIETQPEFDGLFRALVEGDAVGALKSLSELTREGWDPEQLAENFAAEVRQSSCSRSRRKSPTRSTATAIDSSSGGRIWDFRARFAC